MSNLAFSFNRCELSEILRDTLPIPCINACNGCQEALFKEALVEHEELCSYRNINCANLACTEKPVFKDYMDHFNAKHVWDDDDLNGQEDRLVFEADFTRKEAKAGYARRFTKFGRNFFDVGLLVSKNEDSFLKRWLLFQGSPSEAKNLGYESCLTGPDGSKIAIFDKVISLDEKLPQRSKFMIHEDMAESFEQENQMLDYKIKIRNWKEEAKDDDEESGVSDGESSETKRNVAAPSKMSHGAR